VAGEGEGEGEGKAMGGIMPRLAPRPLDRAQPVVRSKTRQSPSLVGR